MLGLPTVKTEVLKNLLKEKENLSTAEAAEILDISRRIVIRYKLLPGQLEGRKESGKWLVKRSSGEDCRGLGRANYAI